MTAPKTGIIDLAVDFIILIFCTVLGFGVYYATNTSGWASNILAIWGLVPYIFIGVGALFLVIKLKTVG